MTARLCHWHWLEDQVLAVDVHCPWPEVTAALSVMLGLVHSGASEFVSGGIDDPRDSWDTVRDRTPATIPRPDLLGTGGEDREGRGPG